MAVVVYALVVEGSRGQYRGRAVWQGKDRAGWGSREDVFIVLII